MVSVADALFAVIVVTGVSLTVLGWSLRRTDGLGVTALAVFTGTFGVGVAVSGMVGLVFRDPEPLVQPLWAQLGFFFWVVSVIPWFLFAMAYTGRYTDPTARLAVALGLPFVIPAANFVWIHLGSYSGVLNALSSVAFIYGLSLAVFGSLLVVQATYSYVHLSVRDGLGLAAAPVLTVIALNSTGNLQQTAFVLAPAVYAVAVVVSGGALWAVTRGGSALDSTPAVETVGKRAIAEQTDDLVFVIDAEGTIIECNPAATEALAADREQLLATPLAAVLGSSSAGLDDSETVTLDTEAGEQQFDPQVSSLSEDGSDLGAVLSLRDVTDRQLREQRLAVLNRVLRHNLRNKIDVIKSHAEVIKADRADDHIQTISDTADEIGDLGADARTIDRFLSNSAAVQQIDLVEVVDGVTETLGVTDRALSVAVEYPETAPVSANRRALEAALTSPIENALEYADDAVEIAIERDGDCYTVTISDDGAGIPEQELQSIDSGTETPLQHGTGLGLWQLKWAVRTIGGELTIETTDGTTIQFTVPTASDPAQS